MMNTNKNKRVLASTKIKQNALQAASAVGAATGTSKGTVFRVILEKVLENCSHEELNALIYGEKTIKIDTP